MPDDLTDVAVQPKRKANIPELGVQCRFNWNMIGQLVLTGGKNDEFIGWQATRYFINIPTHTADVRIKIIREYAKRHDAFPQESDERNSQPNKASK